MSLRTSDFDYPLPEALIAVHPCSHRENSRMMVVYKDQGRWEHRAFADIECFLKPEDILVLNDTKVIPARIFSVDGRSELLLLEPVGEHSWRCMVRPGRRLRVGAVIHAGGVTGKVMEVYENGDRLVDFGAPLDLNKFGQLPLPPYFERQATQEDYERYQTVYARAEGSVAAPTAGLHFTESLLQRIRHAFLTLHVGAGTFRPVQTEILADHPMHSERYELPAATADLVNESKRVIAVGTTSARVLESCAKSGTPLKPGAGRTDLFICPPYDFRVVDALLTNFHLPKSTLLMLVSALAGRELVMEAYREAVREGYRFYSYGDCMLVI
jgi:S-adenosylmethionine:tRNA ribosyltransferase-isomerase